MAPRAVAMGFPGSHHPAWLDLPHPLAGCVWRGDEVCPHPGHEGETLRWVWGRCWPWRPPCRGGPGVRGHLPSGGGSSPTAPWLLAPGGGGGVSPPHGFPQKQPLVTGHGGGRRAAPLPRGLSWRRACSLPPSMAALRELPPPSRLARTLRCRRSPHALPVPPQLSTGPGLGEAGCPPLGPGLLWPPAPRQQKRHDSFTHLSRRLEKISQEKGKRQR